MSEFERCWSKAEHRVLGRIRKCKIGEDAVEDVLQETRIRCWKSFAKFDRKSSFSTWACAVALNLIRDHARKVKRTSTESLDDPTEFGTSFIDLIEADLPDLSEAMAEEAEFESKMDHLRVSLPRQSYDAIKLWIFGKTIDEMAEILDIPPGTVKSRVHRAVNLARQAFGS